METEKEERGREGGRKRGREGGRERVRKRGIEGEGKEEKKKRIGKRGKEREKKKRDKETKRERDKEGETTYNLQSKQLIVATVWRLECHQLQCTDNVTVTTITHRTIHHVCTCTRTEYK